MKKSIKAYRFALWGILSLIVFLAAFFVFLYLQLTSRLSTHPEYDLTSLYRSLALKQFLLAAIIPGLELLVYWFIRHRLYKPWWVRMHVAMLWVAIVVARVLGMLAYGFFVNTQDQRIGVTTAHSILYWACLIIGHLFFIATIVKVFPIHGRRAAPVQLPIRIPER